MDVKWEKFPLVADQETPKAWLTFQGRLGLAPNTLQAYGHALNDYLDFCLQEGVQFEEATKEHIARKLHPKWRAKRLLMHIPNAQIWIDSPRIPRQARDRLWAVLVPVNEAKSP
jgi:hypothetical protein